MRLPPVNIDPSLATLPMREPEARAVTICPACRQKLRRSAELCHHCGAERRYGPTEAEGAICTAVGFVIVPAGASALIGLSGWLVGIALLGAMLGFFTAHLRFGGDRWVRAKA